MKIQLRPDPTRSQLDIRFMHPVHATQEIRRRLVAPAGLDLDLGRRPHHADPRRRPRPRDRRPKAL